jgi:hypothetical protein
MGELQEEGQEAHEGHEEQNNVCGIELDWCAVEPKQFFVTFVPSW